MAFEIPKQPYSGKIGTTTVGTGSAAVTLGGETCYPFHLFEGEMPNPPKIAMEVWDYDPSNEWPQAAVKPFMDVIASPEAWARKCVETYGANMIVLQLKSTDPNGMDRSPEEASEVAKKVIDAVEVPVVVWGTANNQKDEEVLKKISEKCEGKNLALSPVEEGNHKGVGASALGYKHAIVASTPIDVNLAKQLNILLGNLGVSKENILVDPTTGGLGYGMEYSYSVMERIRMAALTQEDEKLQIPMISNIGNEIWKCKEAGQSIDEAPTLGDPEKRAILMEVVAAVCYLLSGSDVAVLRHPESVRLVRAYVDLMINGGSAMDVAGISKNMELHEADLLALSPEPDLDFGGREVAKEKPATKAEKAAPQPKAEKEAKPAEPPKKAEKVPAKSEKVVELRPQAEAKAKAEAEAKVQAEAKAREEAEAKVRAEAKAREEAEAKVRAEAKAREEAEAEAEAKVQAEAKAREEAKTKEKEELHALRQKRAQERAKLETERKARATQQTTTTPAVEQLTLVEKLMQGLERIHKHS